MHIALGVHVQQPDHYSVLTYAIELVDLLKRTEDRINLKISSR